MDTKKISRAFLGLCFITFLISCEDSDVVSYPEYDLSYEMDTTRFLNTGEERTISLKFVRRKAIDNIKNSDEDKKQIFEHLVPIAEKSWSDTPNISNRYRQHSTDQSGTLAHILPYLLLPY